VQNTKGGLIHPKHLFDSDSLNVRDSSEQVLFWEDRIKLLLLLLLRDDTVKAQLIKDNMEI